jgi:hypothetical protein
MHGRPLAEQQILLPNKVLHPPSQHPAFPVGVGQGEPVGLQKHSFVSGLQIVGLAQTLPQMPPQSVSVVTQSEPQHVCVGSHVLPQMPPQTALAASQIPSQQMPGAAPAVQGMSETGSDVQRPFASQPLTRHSPGSAQELGSPSQQRVSEMHPPWQQPIPLPHCRFVVHGEHRLRTQNGASGSVHSPSSQQSPLRQRPSQHNSLASHGCAASHVGQHEFPRSQPELSSPVSVWVRHKMALLVLALPNLAPRTSASTRQVLSRLAPEKFAFVNIAPAKLAPRRLAPLKF